MRVELKKKLGDFSLNVAFTGQEGGVTALFGPSGSGKTSVLHMVAGLISPDAGCIQMGGRTLFSSHPPVNIPTYKRRLGYVFQEGRLFPHLSVTANLTYGMKRGTQDSTGIHMAHLVELLDIGPLLQRRPSKLSGGEKQRVAIGRALLSNPHALLMDEPLAALDPARKQELLPYIQKINEEFSISIIYVSHSLEEIHALTQHVVHIQNGHIA